jgi:hypothetical protein
MAAALSIEPRKRISEPGESALRPKRCLLAIPVKLCKVVASKLILDWSHDCLRETECPLSSRGSYKAIYFLLRQLARAVVCDIVERGGTGSCRRAFLEFERRSR